MILKKLLIQIPLIAKALIKLGDNYKKKNQDIVSKVENISGKFIDNQKNSFPGEVVSDFIQENENYFPKLEEFANRIFSLKYKTITELVIYLYVHIY